MYTNDQGQYWDALSQRWVEPLQPKAKAKVITGCPRSKFKSLYYWFTQDYTRTTDITQAVYSIAVHKTVVEGEVKPAKSFKDADSLHNLLMLILKMRVHKGRTINLSITREVG